MRNTSNILAAAMAALLLAGAPLLAHAGNISGVKAEPANGQAGAPIKVTVTGEDEGICGLRVEYGNGDVDVSKMNKGKDDFPRAFTKTYNKAGTYTIIAKGGKDGSTFGCNGEAKTQVVIAEAPKAAAAAPAAAPAAAAAPACPEGYKLNAKSVNKKTGAFTCAAGKGAKKPEKALECTSGAEYFSNAKGTSLGCRKPVTAKK